MIEEAKKYFDNASKEEIEKDWEELKEYDEISPVIVDTLQYEDDLIHDIDILNRMIKQSSLIRTNKAMSDNIAHELEKYKKLIEINENAI